MTTHRYGLAALIALALGSVGSAQADPYLPRARNDVRLLRSRPDVSAPRFRAVATASGGLRSSLVESGRLRWLGNPGGAGLQGRTATLGLEGLLDRYALNPARFNVFHPEMAPVLGRILGARAGVAAGLPSEGGILPATPRIDYFTWRRGLNPQRFDTYHPLIGAVLGEDLRLRHLASQPPIGVGPGTLFPPTMPPGGDVGGVQVPGGEGNPGGGDNPVPVPEPSALLLVGLGALGLASRAARFRPAGASAPGPGPSAWCGAPHRG
jgi:hypothetical protein